MQTRTLSLEYRELDPGDLDAATRSLHDAARAATRGAYAPYSRFRVGAAAELESGELVSAANLENAAYPQCLCAEAALLGTLHSQHAAHRVRRLAIAVDAPTPRNEVAAPCGSCRQQLVELERRQGSPVALHLLRGGPQDGAVAFAAVADLLPFGFALEV